MKRTFLIFFFTILFGCFFINTANSDENSLNLIIDTDRQYSQASSVLIKQKINDLNKNLSLTEEQKQKAEAIGLNSAKKLHIYQVKFIDEKNELITMRKTGAPIAQIQAQIKVIQSIKSRLNITRKKNINEFEAILVSQQQEYFNQFKIELQKIKEKENHLNREIQEVQTRDDALKSLENSN